MTLTLDQARALQNSQSPVNAEDRTAMQKILRKVNLVCLPGLRLQIQIQIGPLPKATGG